MQFGQRVAAAGISVAREAEARVSNAEMTLLLGVHDVEEHDQRRVALGRFALGRRRRRETRIQPIDDPIQSASPSNEASTIREYGAGAPRLMIVPSLTRRDRRPGACFINGIRRWARSA